MSNQTTNNEPVVRLKDGMIQIAIWENVTTEGKTFYTVSKVKRTYKDNGNYKETDSLSGTQLLQAARLLERAYDRIRDMEEANYQASKGEAA